ncbi:MAG: formate dehydrogenase subunit delta [Dokdonella sp.]
MNSERLVQMANDIAAYFESEPDRVAAIAGVAMHLQRYWDPRMRNAIIAHAQTGATDLSELARAGVEKLAETAMSA